MRWGANSFTVGAIDLSLNYKNGRQKISISRISKLVLMLVSWSKSKSKFSQIVSRLLAYHSHGTHPLTFERKASRVKCTVCLNKTIVTRAANASELCFRYSILVFVLVSEQPEANGVSVQTSTPTWFSPRFDLA
jgi:hypothetical protein